MQISKSTALIFISILIITKSLFCTIFPEIQKDVQAFFSKQLDILAVIGHNLSENGVSAVYATTHHDEIKEVSSMQLGMK